MYSVKIPELTNYVKHDINLSPFRYTKYYILFYLDPVGNKCLPVDEKNLTKNFSEYSKG